MRSDLKTTEPPRRSGGKLAVVVTLQIGIPAVLLLERLITGRLMFGGWAWGMYT